MHDTAVTVGGSLGVGHLALRADLIGTPAPAAGYGSGRLAITAKSHCIGVTPPGVGGQVGAIAVQGVAVQCR